MEHHLSTIFNNQTFSNGTSRRSGPLLPLSTSYLTFLCCISFLTVTGDTMVIHVMRRSGSTLRSVSYNLWLVSLATSDLLVSIIILPTYVLSTSAYDHPSGQQGDALCKFLTGYSITYWLLKISIFHVIGISIERFKVIVDPIATRALVSNVGTKRKSAIAWIVLFLVHVPLSFVYLKYSDNHRLNGLSSPICRFK